MPKRKKNVKSWKLVLNDDVVYNDLSDSDLDKKLEEITTLMKDKSYNLNIVKN